MKTNFLAGASVGLLIIAFAGCASSDLPLHKQTPTPGGTLNPDPEQPKHDSLVHDFQQQPPTGSEAVKAPNW
ncbi:MAG: hypothetical protein QM796_02880 [Chthoniobacteraceae bacterium]